MNRSTLLVSFGAAFAACASATFARPEVRVWNDPVGDALVRRSDLGCTAPMIPGATLPDLTSLTLSGWMPQTPGGDRYTGSIAPAASAEILRLQLTFAGRLNPPGPDLFPDMPTMFGGSPVYGYIDFDVDGDINTGGELPFSRYNYLEQVARFGALPTGPLFQRAVTERSQVDLNYESPPFYERSGSDFTLVFSGQTPIEIVAGDTNFNGTFDAGETWDVRGRFFQRAAGYQCASFCFGGFESGLYEPLCDMRFSHCTQTNRTTITLVFPLTMVGAAILTGEPVQLWDFTFDFGNHSSVFEALSDVIIAVEEDETSATCLLSAANWEGRSAEDYLNVLTWSATAIFATTYAQHPEGASYIWTDVGFAQVMGDFNGDGRADSTDRASIIAYIAAHDGGPKDCDAVHNNSVRLCNFCQNYVVYDINGDGFVNNTDLGLIPQLCPADWDRQSGLNTNDFFAFLADFFAGDADFNGDGITNSADFLDYISAFFVGCP